MQFLHKLTSKTPNSSSLCYITSRFLTTRNPNPNRNHNPDEPSSAYYDELINAAGCSKDFVAVHRLLSKRFRDGFFNTTNTFKFISTDLSVLDDLSHALSTLDRGFSRKSAYDSLIACLCKIHRSDEARRVMETVVRERYGANATTFHPILNALTKKKNMEDAWRLMEFMKENGISPDLTAYNSLLTAYCFVGDLTSAAGVLTKMEVEEGMEADSRTYDALVLGACRAGRVEGALVVLRRMEDDGLPPMYSTHAHVINALLKLGYYAQAIEFVMIYGGRDKGLDTESFGLLAYRLMNLKRFDEAKLVLEEMKGRGLAMGDRLKDFYSLRISEE
ncbi:pentatricopeptide repeat-containing protein At3g56030, mitochondrial-like [Cornus florida]|uniref:pentatricopeptide repeat-containing protein At3g56030, mitochondrial-like n=1 Tax=Cornus florida TaxID=4283 RepID=UPI002898CC1D|nr:pentatricopeptide repeat-containing protein At3g56030, mitochondrial-like [Cornus florida]XP_059627953.1 pentatricopeptide repeat-containing protein At3g56030, mitochondrial-like [Cornus florida]